MHLVEMTNFKDSDTKKVKQKEEIGFGNFQYYLNSRVHFPKSRILRKADSRGGI